MLTIKGIREKLPLDIQPIAKMLVLDIETAMMRVHGYTYRLKQYSDRLKSSWIDRPIWIPCVSWKWIGSNVIGSVSVLNDRARFEADYADDYHVVKTMHDVINSADIIIGHNLDRFDMRQINKRFIKHNLPPMRPIKTIDTLKIARQVADFESNELRYLARFLGLQEKDESPDWDLVAIGDPKEIEACVRYNRQDIRVTEQVYKRLIPYSRARPNIGNYQRGVHHSVCPVCGCGTLEPDQPFDTGQSLKEGFRCKNCKTYVKGKKSIKTTDLK